KLQNAALGTIFNGNHAQTLSFFGWCLAKSSNEPAPAPGVVLTAPTEPMTNVAAFAREVTNKQDSTIRYEDIEHFFTTYKLDPTVRTTVLKWLADNQVVSGEKFSKLNTHYEGYIFDKIQGACHGGQPVVLATRNRIGTPSGSGHSANEPK